MDIDTEELSTSQSKLSSITVNFSIRQIFELIRLSKECNRYEDLLSAYECLYKVYPKCHVSLTEIYPIEYGIKSLISEKQRKLKKLENLLNYSKQKDFNDSSDNTFFVNGIMTQKKELENSMALCCKKSLNLLNNFILPNLYSTGKPTDREIEVFCMRIKGDLYKYLSFIEKDQNEKKKKNIQAKGYYKDSYQFSQDYLEPTSMSYIDSAISYSKYLGTFEGNTLEAKIIIKDLIEKLNSEQNPEIRPVLIKKVGELYEMFNMLEKK